VCRKIAAVYVSAVDTVKSGGNVVSTCLCGSVLVQSDFATSYPNLIFVNILILFFFDVLLSFP
jgi:hypothetical protein